MDVRAVVEAGSPHKSCTRELQVDRHACASREYVSRVAALSLIIPAVTKKLLNISMYTVRYPGYCAVES